MNLIYSAAINIMCQFVEQENVCMSCEGERHQGH